MKLQSYHLESMPPILQSFSLQIVRTDRSMEQIVFPIPEICEYLPVDSKHRVLQSAERDDQGSKVADFFSRLDNLFHEMKWQKKLRGKRRHKKHQL